MFSRVALLFIIGCLLSPLPAFAQRKIDYRCFTLEECVAARQELGISDPAIAAEGFYTGPDSVAACGTNARLPGGKTTQLGFCLPAGQTTTQITFGGRDEFSNIGDFIQFIYRYGIAILGLAAVLVIVISGIQWTASGGNSGAIESAKKRIGRAIIGLCIALLSYTILAAVNPQLVSLRLPQIWLIKTASEPFEYCDTAPASTKIATFAPEGTEATDEGKRTMYGNAVFDKLAQDAMCGEEYFLDGAGGETCIGLKCQHPGQLCLKDRIQEPGHCFSGAVHGRITAQNSLFCKDLAKNKISDEIDLMVVCDDGHVESVGELDPKKDVDESQFFLFQRNVIDTARQTCQNHGPVIGYYLVVQINDEQGGLVCEGGEDDLVAVGRSPYDAHACSVNLSVAAHLIARGKPLNCVNGSEDEYCSCAGTKWLLNGNKQDLTQNEEFQKLLLSPKDVEAGIVCNVHITRSEFPRQNNDVSFGKCEN